MALRVSNVSLRLDEPESALPGHLARILNLPTSEIRGWRILRKSLDARSPEALHFVYSAEVSLGEEAGIVARFKNRNRNRPARVDSYREVPFVPPPPGNRHLPCRPVVIGSGPAGLAAA